MARLSPVRLPERASRTQKYICAVRRVAVAWKGGIHLRPAAVLIKTAKLFKSRITIEVPSAGSICLQDPRDIRAFLTGQQSEGETSSHTFGARYGTEIVIRAKGPDAKKAADEIARIFTLKEEDLLEEQEHFKGRAV